MKRKLIILLTIVFVIGIMAPVIMAAAISGIDIPDRDPSTPWHDITLAQAFDTAKLGNRTVTVDGKSQKDVIIACRVGPIIAIDSMADGYKKSPDKSFDEFVRSYLSSRARDYVMFYPDDEVISINGVPWQKSEHGDILKERIEHFIDYLPSEEFSKDEDQQEVVFDPVYNGLGQKIFDGGMSLAEAKQKGLEAQGGGVVIPEGENITLTMVLNNPKYTVKTKAGTVTKTLDVAPFAKYGVTLVPVRGVFESFDAKVEWLPATKTVKVTKGNDLIILKINSKTATVNGKSVQLLQPAQITGGRTMIPLRFISENIGYNVQYISKTKKIIITD